MLDESRSEEHQYFSPRGIVVGEEEIKSLLDPIELFFMFVSKGKWKFYKMDTTEYNVYHEDDGFFERMKNDACFVMTDHQQYFLSLFTNGH